MSIAECYVINVQCDGEAHGKAFIPRDQFTGGSKREAHANMRDCGWKIAGDGKAYCRECAVPWPWPANAGVPGTHNTQEKNHG